MLSARFGQCAAGGEEWSGEEHCGGAPTAAAHRRPRASARGIGSATASRVVAALVLGSACTGNQHHIVKCGFHKMEIVDLSFLFLIRPVIDI